MADELFDNLWRRPGGKELLGLHSLYGAGALPLGPLREILGLERDEFDAAVEAARNLGLLEVEGDCVRLVPHEPGSLHRVRLEACLDEHRETWTALLPKLTSRLLIRFFASPPGPARA